MYLNILGYIFDIYIFGSKLNFYCVIGSLMIIIGNLTNLKDLESQDDGMTELEDLM
jgi:hypothetical protein